MRLVPINCVKENTFLAQTIYDRDNRILLKKGVRLNENLLKKIEENGIYTIYINDEYSDNEIEDIIKPELRNAAVKSTKDTFDNVEKLATSANNNRNSLKSKQLLKNIEQGIQSLNNLSKDIVEEILSNQNLLINLVDIKSLDNYVYQHSVNVGVLSMVLGMELGLNKNELYDLCIGAILHDIGKTFLPKEILYKKSDLTDDEYAIAKQHAQKGYEYLKAHYHLPVVTKIIALQHHERLDGSGYPNGYQENQINKLARIVAIADTYDAMTSDRPYRLALPPNEAIEFIMGSAGRFFDFEMVQVFARKIVPYPVGSLVKLSNNDVGVVEEVPPHFPLRPKVKVIRQRAISIEMKMVDLMKETNLVIEGLQYEAPNVSVPHHLQEYNSFKKIHPK